MRTFIVFVFLLFINQAFSQKQWFVRFIDKDTSECFQVAKISEKTIQKRQASGIEVFDYYDIAVDTNYINDLKSIGCEVGFVSNWLNGTFVLATKKQIEEISNLVCVNSIQKINPHSKGKLSGKKVIISNSDETDSLLKAQIDAFNGQYFIKNGIDGEGITIAVFDGGFPNVDRAPEFAHLRDNNQILDTYDFVRKRKDVYDFNKHGTMVLSCIAGISDDKNMGLATGANFLLARTEKFTEPFSEEENWLAAAEWAANNGADIINSSLGYTYHRYFPNQMDGRTSFISEAARIAARKGILVINAMGNDGNNKWHFVGTPADVDSVLSVGGIDPETGIHINFSSFGPSFDNTRKPDVSAFGKAITRNRNGITEAYGTSFATPLTTGFAACVWQLYPELNNMQIFELIQKSGSLYPYFDYAHGYGVPDARYFFKAQDTLITDFKINSNDAGIDVYISDSARDKATDDLLYWHIESPDGVLRKFQVIKVYSNTPLALSAGELEEGETLRVWFNNTVKEFKK